MKPHYDVRIKDQSKVFFTSDLHHNHLNIIRYCNRPYNSVEEMNEGLVQSWNSVVPEDGHTFILGDLSFSKDFSGKAVPWLLRLNGTKSLILGNHDKHVAKADLSAVFYNHVFEMADVLIGDQPVVLCHYPMVSWNGSHRGSWQLYGHVHGTIPDPKDKYQMDVGVDCNNMKPFTFEQIKANMATKTPALTTGRNL